MNKTDLKRRLKNARLPHTNRAIADLLGIKTEQAVQKWPDSGIPLKHFYYLLVHHPNLMRGAKP